VNGEQAVSLVEDRAPPARTPLNSRTSYRRLPRRIKPSDTFTSHPVSPARDPEGGRDTNRDFVIRYGDPSD
jgi:hypothetical protein